MQAIHTKFLPCTDTRGARIKAKLGPHAFTIGYPYDLSGQEVHRAAAKALLEDLVKRGLENADTLRLRFDSGMLPDQSYAHVFVD